MLACSDLQVVLALRHIIAILQEWVGLQRGGGGDETVAAAAASTVQGGAGGTILQEINGRRVKYAPEMHGETNRRSGRSPPTAGSGAR
jgi:hypothetical protein